MDHLDIFRLGGAALSNFVEIILNLIYMLGAAIGGITGAKICMNKVRDNEGSAVPIVLIAIIVLITAAQYPEFVQRFYWDVLFDPEIQMVSVI